MRSEHYLVVLLCSFLKQTYSEISSEDEDSVLFKNSDMIVNKIDVNRTSISEERTLEHLLSEYLENEVSDRRVVEESRKRKKGKDDKGFMEKILPMMVMPFMVSTSMIPMMLVSLVAMLIKSALIGKVGIILMLLNMFRQRTNNGGVFSHNVNVNSNSKEAAMEHYGYHGDEEYGAYVNSGRNLR